MRAKRFRQALTADRHGFWFWGDINTLQPDRDDGRTMQHAHCDPTEVHLRGGQIGRAHV